MKICTKCNKKWPKGKFCEDCGGQLKDEVQELLCPSCKTKLNAGARFCPECGAKVDATDLSSLNDLAPLGYDGIKQCPVCKTYFSATKTTCPKCDMTCGESTINDVLYEEAAKNGDAKAAAYLEKCAEIQRKREAEEKAAIEAEEKELLEAERLAEENGEKDYHEALHLMYSENADEADFPRAFELFKDSADKGYIKSFFWLARCYDFGKGCEMNDGYAVHWYKKAVEYDNDPYAMADLGEMYLFGYGITKDERKAFELFKKSAAKEVSNGQFWLGWCSINGAGCEVNENRAYQNFHLAVKNDYGATAKLWLGRCYENGWGTNQNPEKAYQFYKEAANEGNWTAIFNLGGCLLYGFGIQQDKERGLELIRQAADSGYCDEAVEFLNELKNTTESTGDVVKRMLKKNATGAAAGAAIGSIVPGVGTAIGGLIGWAAGGIKAYLDEK